jgi:hypothetical protein
MTIYLWLYTPCWLWLLFQFLNLYTFCRTPCTGDEPVARPLPAHRTTQTQNKRTQIIMPHMGSEPTIPVFERPKTVHASDRAVTMIGQIFITSSANIYLSDSGLWDQLTVKQWFHIYVSRNKLILQHNVKGRNSLTTEVKYKWLRFSVDYKTHTVSHGCKIMKPHVLYCF